uniref:Uncharacterized protein n=1 Tax=Amphimedon queenslandica TaxID=400682 RepID=A0A1X7UCI5_AMPQE
RQMFIGNSHQWLIWAGA